MRRLGFKLSRQTVKNILVENGFDPAPSRGAGTWAEFLKTHAESLWQADFLQRKVWTPRGAIDCFVVVAIRIGSRRSWVSPTTAQPDTKWMAQQARNFAIAEDAPEHAILFHDRDTKFAAPWKAILKDSGFRPTKLPIRAPNLNCYVERAIQSIQHECLDNFVILGERHFGHLVSEYVAYHNRERPHSELGGCTPSDRGVPFPTAPPSPDRVVRRSRLGVVLNWYEARAASRRSHAADEQAEAEEHQQRDGGDGDLGFRVGLGEHQVEAVQRPLLAVVGAGGVDGLGERGRFFVRGEHREVAADVVGDVGTHRGTLRAAAMCRPLERGSPRGRRNGKANSFSAFGVGMASLVRRPRGTRRRQGAMVMYCLEAIVAMNASDKDEARETWQRLVEQNAEAERPAPVRKEAPPTTKDIVPAYYY